MWNDIFTAMWASYTRKIYVQQNALVPARYIRSAERVSIINQAIRVPIYKRPEAKTMIESGALAAMWNTATMIGLSSCKP